MRTCWIRIVCLEGKHPECSPDGCCINSNFARLLQLPKFPYRELGCVCTSRCPASPPGWHGSWSPWDMSPRERSRDSMSGRQLLAATSPAIFSITREQHRGSGSNQNPIQVYGHVSIWRSVFCLGCDHPRHSLPLQQPGLQ